MASTTSTALRGDWISGRRLRRPACRLLCSRSPKGGDTKRVFALRVFQPCAPCVYPHSCLLTEQADARFVRVLKGLKLKPTGLSSFLAKARGGTTGPACPAVPRAGPVPSYGSRPTIITSRVIVYHGAVVTYLADTNAGGPLSRIADENRQRTPRRRHGQNASWLLAHKRGTAMNVSVAIRLAETRAGSGGLLGRVQPGTVPAETVGVQRFLFSSVSKQREQDWARSDRPGAAALAGRWVPGPKR
jgi:hypothetical protein